MTTKNSSDKSKHLMLMGGGIILVVVIIIFGSAKLMGSAQPEATPSSVSIGQGDGVKTTEVTPSYRKQMGEHNAEQRKLAEQQGRSVLPILLPEQSEPQPTPAEIKAKHAEANKANEPEKQAAQPQISPEAMQAKSEAMRAMMTGLLQRPQPSRTLVVGNTADDIRKVASTQSGGGNNQQNVALDRSTQISAAPPIAFAGDTVFAVLNSQINTDEPDMVHMTVTSGPLKGGTLVGTATRQNEVVKVAVTSLFLDRKAYNLTGQVMDIDSARGVLSGDVDRKLIQRYGLPFVSGFVTGLGQAIAQGSTQTASTVGAIGLGGTTSVTTAPLDDRQIAGAALGAGAMGINQQIQASARNTAPSVYIPSGLAVGVFLLSDVVLKSGPDTKAATNFEAALQPAPQQQEQRSNFVQPINVPYAMQPGQFPRQSIYTPQRQIYGDVYRQ